MKDGTILLQEIEEDKIPNNIEGLFYRAIIYFTQSKILHVLVYLNGKSWESTFYMNGDPFSGGKFEMFSGVKKSKRVVGHTLALEPIKDMTEEEKVKMKKYMENMIENKRPYNLLRLIIMALVYPTRWFWNFIGWVPFSKNIYGEFCSSFVDEAWKAAGRDLFENSQEELTAPVDFLKLVDLGTFRKVG